MRRYTRSKATKEKLSKAHKTSPLAIAARQRLHAAQIGRPRDPVTRAKMKKTEFKKGQTPWNKGKKTGHIPWNKGKRGYSIHSDEFKAKISSRMRGKNNTAGKPVRLETRLKLSEAHKGARHYNWKGGVTPENMRIRRSMEIRHWRLAVFTRDNYTCVLCKKRGGILNADHIKPFATFLDLRLELSNGRTLCITCHKNTDTYAKNLKNAKA